MHSREQRFKNSTGAWDGQSPKFKGSYSMCVGNCFMHQFIINSVGHVGPWCQIIKNSFWYSEMRFHKKVEIRKAWPVYISMAHLTKFYCSAWSKSKT